MHTYGLTLAPGQFVRAVFDQRGVDVEVALLDPEGRELLRVNNPTGSWGLDAIFFEAERGGKYTAVVSPAATCAPPGRYQFDMEKGDPGSAAEGRLAAERALSRASLAPRPRGGEAHAAAAGRYDEALRLFRDASDRRGEITALRIAGSVAAALGDAQKALSYFHDLLALHDGEKYMVERYRNVVFTPASNSRLKDPTSPEWKVLGAGVSKAHPGFSPLPGVLDELRGIVREPGAEAAGVLDGKVMLDDAFTADTFRAGLRQRFQAVHIASHFAVQPGNETDSFLLLGDGSRLSLSQIRGSVNLFGGVELLALSACDTATGGTGSDGKEVESFAVLAQRQGAKAVMASLWPVADESTKQLMQNFYRLRDAQVSVGKAEALRQAQLALLRGEAGAGEGGVQRRGIRSSVQGAGAKGSYSHPFFWAPFILIGNWR